MRESPADSPPTPADREILLAAYQAICSRHQQIDEFRAKLLALLPIASGTAGVLLLRSSPRTDAFETSLTPIGIFGLAATLGIFIYELYGISVCKQIMEMAGSLEDQLGIPKGMGQFRDRKQYWLHLPIGAEMASWVVYVSVLAGWLYVAGAPGLWHHIPSFLIIVVAAVVLLVRGMAISWPNWWQKCHRK